MKILRERIKDAKRIVIKVGSSSLTYPETGKLNLAKMEVLVRQLSSLQNAGKDVVLVSSGAIMVGWQALGLDCRPQAVSQRQACASVGQARLMMLYQKFFSEYGQHCSQILLTKYSLVHDQSRINAINTFEELLKFGVIPIVNENDTISTDEIEVGDNDTLGAIVASLIQADLLILLSDIDGLYTDDPNKNPDAQFIDEVQELTEEILKLGKGSSSAVGTGGMATKLNAAKLVGASGCDMVIANAQDFHIISRIMQAEKEGTFFVANQDPDYRVDQFLEAL